MRIRFSVAGSLEALGLGSLDPALNLRFLTLGPWFLTTGWLGLRTSKLPRALAYLGIMAGFFALVFAAATIIEVQVLLLLSGVLAVIIHPLWLICLGLVLQR